MSKQELNRVEREKCMAVVADVGGLDTKEQSAYIKVTAPGRSGRLYIAKSSRVTRVTMSGLNMAHEAVVNFTREQAKELKLGKVDAQIDFTKDEEQILSALRVALEALKTSPERAEKPAEEKASVDETAEQAAAEQAAAGAAE